MHRALALLVAGLLPLSACGQVPPPEVLAKADVELVEDPPWRSVASADDAGRIERIGAAWEQALARARRAGFTRRVAREGSLLAPNAALPMPAPTPGSYMCRLIRFADPAPRASLVSVYRPFFCFVGVDRDSLSITKQTGSLRPSGYLWTDAVPSRMVFLGSMADGPDEPLIPYGADGRRDLIGVFERVDDFRFRLVIPWPRSGAVLEVYELVPNVPQS